MNPGEAQMTLIACEVAPRDVVDVENIVGEPFPSVGAGPSLGPDGLPRIMVLIHDDLGERGIAMLDAPAFTKFMATLAAASEVCAAYASSRATAH